MTFREEGLEKEAHRQKEKKCRIMKKSKNMDDIVCLLLLDTEQKIVRNLVNYKFLDICPVHGPLFYTVLQLFFKSNIRQMFVYYPTPYFLTNKTHPKRVF